ncbi:MAG: hydantoinase B/oxoprolinase family protein, partial [Phycisphaerales bacterium]|nr:hydantoinase B/oxoprolinase family protein [Phycisphaerales bacterium]
MLDDILTLLRHDMVMAHHPEPADGVELEILRLLLVAATEQMGHTLARTGYSANIKERRDFSCALFTPDGRLLCQAAHVPVHLGSMPASVHAALAVFPRLAAGDVVLLNDPFAGGTHLPDITMIAPVCLGEQVVALACNRAHHADVGGLTSGSMPVSSSIFHEGIRIPPVKWIDGGVENDGVLALLLANVRTPDERVGDLRAQRAANAVGARAVLELIERYGEATLARLVQGLLDYGERVMRGCIAEMPDGVYVFDDVMDNDGVSDAPVVLRVTLTVAGDEATMDFTGSSPQVAGCINCPAAVTHSAVSYVFAALAGDRLPHNAGAYRPIRVLLPDDCVLNARFPAAVVGGNVETSQRVVDVLLGALAQAVPERVCAASAGTMSSLSLGGVDPRTGRRFTHYETIGGGMGASLAANGESAVQTHMTNTMNTPVEALEMAFPLRVTRYAVAEGSGGAGRYRGGDGITREIEALADMDGALLAERHRHRPWGLAGGSPGTAGSAT